MIEPVCHASANIAGEHVPCQDTEHEHPGLAHHNKDHQIIWWSDVEYHAAPNAARGELP